MSSDRYVGTSGPGEPRVAGSAGPGRRAQLREKSVIRVVLVVATVEHQTEPRSPIDLDDLGTEVGQEAGGTGQGIKLRMCDPDREGDEAARADASGHLERSAIARPPEFVEIGLAVADEFRIVNGLVAETHELEANLSLRKARRHEAPAGPQPGGTEYHRPEPAPAQSIASG